MISNPLRIAERRILVEQVRLIMGNFRSTLPIIPVAIMLLWVLSDDSNMTSMRLWCAAVILSNLNLQRYVRHHLASGIPLDQVRHRVMVLGILNAVDGLLWGALSWITLDTASQSSFIMVIALNAFMLGAVLPTQSAIPLMYISFALPQLIAFITQLWLLGAPNYQAMSMAFILYFAALLGQACNCARATRASIDVSFELADSHAKLREIEYSQALAQERQRLMQDMHDGLGSSLVSALWVVEHGHMDEAELAQVLQGCIEDLQLAIDSMEPVDADLLLLLATLRYRLGPRLDGSGISLRWEVQDVPALDWLDPRNALHILRILQEGFTNIIKHTQATEIRIATEVESTHVTVTVADNGQGFDVDNALKSEGKGLSNQLRRAESIGAEIKWSSDDTGTRFTLRLPIKHA